MQLTKYMAQPPLNPKEEVDKFPGVRYGPHGAHGIFHNEDEVPEGWTDNPHDFDTVVDESTGKVSTGPVADDPTPAPHRSKKTLMELLVANNVPFNRSWDYEQLAALVERKGL